MQKVWQWIRDKKGSSFRKWQSTSLATRRDSGGVSVRNGAKKGLRPIGGSEDAIASRRDSSRRRKHHHKNQRKVAVAVPVAEQALFELPTDDQVFDDFFDEVKPAIEALHKQRRGSIRSQHVITDYIDGDHPVTGTSQLLCVSRSAPSSSNGTTFFDGVQPETEPLASTSGEELGEMKEEAIEREEERPEGEEAKPEKVLRFNLPERLANLTSDLPHIPHTA
uniref:Uncharacterized protein n=1 Tax=Steinernema glaseri TaxID=37863 RepID=A0A1I8AVG2_9BILA